MANLASRRAQKWANFFIVVPKFTPPKGDRKGVRNAGVWNFHDIWAFGGPTSASPRFELPLSKLTFGPSAIPNS